jgi:hypothetical protein
MLLPLFSSGKVRLDDESAFIYAQVQKNSQRSTERCLLVGHEAQLSAIFPIHLEVVREVEFI